MRGRREVGREREVLAALFREQRDDLRAEVPAEAQRVELLGWGRVLLVVEGDAELVEDGEHEEGRLVEVARPLEDPAEDDVHVVDPESSDDPRTEPPLDEQAGVPEDPAPQVAGRHLAHAQRRVEVEAIVETDDGVSAVSGVDRELAVRALRVERERDRRWWLVGDDRRRLGEAGPGGRDRGRVFAKPLVERLVGRLLALRVRVVEHAPGLVAGFLLGEHERARVERSEQGLELLPGGANRDVPAGLAVGDVVEEHVPLDGRGASLGHRAAGPVGEKSVLWAEADREAVLDVVRQDGVPGPLLDVELVEGLAERVCAERGADAVSERDEVEVLQDLAGRERWRGWRLVVRQRRHRELVGHVRVREAARGVARDRGHVRVREAARGGLGRDEGQERDGGRHGTRAGLEADRVFGGQWQNGRNEVGRNGGRGG